jgi:DNA polymerase sigma
MPSKKQLFKPEVEAALRDFLEYYENYVQELINKSEDPANRRHYQKLKNYTHNIILRRARLETDTSVFGSRVIGTSTPSSDLDLYVGAGE